MNLTDKYRSVLNLGEELNVTDGSVVEENGVLKVRGTAQTQYDKDRMWDQIKEIGGLEPTDLIAELQILNITQSTLLEKVKA